MSPLQSCNRHKVSDWLVPARPAAHFFSYETEFRKKAEKHSQRIQHGKKGRGATFAIVTFASHTFDNEVIDFI